MEIAGATVVSHAMPLLPRFGSTGAVIENGNLVVRARVEGAIAHQRRMMQAG